MQANHTVCGSGPLERPYPIVQLSAGATSAFCVSTTVSYACPLFQHPSLHKPTPLRTFALRPLRKTCSAQHSSSMPPRATRRQPHAISRDSLIQCSLRPFLVTGGLDEQRSDLALYEELRQEDDDSLISEDDADPQDTTGDEFPERLLPPGLRVDSCESSAQRPSLAAWEKRFVASIVPGKPLFCVYNCSHQQPPRGWCNLKRVRWRR